MASKKGKKTEARKSGIGDFVRELLAKGGKTYDQIAETARAKFGSQTSVASVAWYKSQMVENGDKVAEITRANRPAKSKPKKAKVKKTKVKKAKASSPQTEAQAAA